MNINELFADPEEKPLERIVDDGGFCSIFRSIACVGDSLSSGEFEGRDDEGKPTFHDYFDYSWGQYIARAAGCKVYNFSRGGMTASEYCESFAEQNGFWDKDKACQAYIIALGVNDLSSQSDRIGGISDIDFKNYKNNKPTIIGYYAQIVQRLKEIQPDAKFFFVTMPRNNADENRENLHMQFTKLIYKLADNFSNSYVIDLEKYAPVYDENFRKLFYLGGHLNPCGYIYTAKLISSYIDYIIRHNMEDFKQVGFIGTPFRYHD